MRISRKSVIVVEYFNGWADVERELPIEDDGTVLFEPEEIKELLWFAWMDCRHQVEKGRLVLENGVLSKPDEQVRRMGKP